MLIKEIAKSQQICKYRRWMGHQLSKRYKRKLVLGIYKPNPSFFLCIASFRRPFSIII